MRQSHVEAELASELDRPWRRPIGETPMMGRPSKSKLSDAEREVLAAAARGLTSQETADQLGRSLQTVKTQRKTLMAHLGATNMTHALWLALERGEIDSP